MAEPIFDHERLDVYRLTSDQVAFSSQIAKSQAGPIVPLAINGFPRPNRFRGV
jgi:hypothetical protein